MIAVVIKYTVPAILPKRVAPNLSRGVTVVQVTDKPWQRRNSDIATLFVIPSKEGIQTSHVLIGNENQSRITPI